MAVVAAIAIGAALSISLPVAAEAATGSKSCGGSTPWGYQSATGSGLTMVPPGSQKIYSIASAGSYTREAAFSDGSGKQGGGTWSVTGTTLSTYNNFCQSFG